MRKEFYTKFKEIFCELKDQYKISYFSHNVIKNYYQSDHFVSSFGTIESWSDLYWRKYWNQDLVEKSCHSITFKKGSSISIWKAIDEESECAQERMKVCKSTDGFLIALDHGQDILENISFGWKKIEDDPLTFRRIEQLNMLIRPLREHHLKTYEKYS